MYNIPNCIYNLLSPSIYLYFYCLVLNNKISISGCMKLNKDDFYYSISDLITKAEFEDRINNYYDRYSGLLTKDVIAHLIVDELGRNVYNISKFYELKPGTRGSVFVTVISPEPRTFTNKKTNASGVELHISDPTGNGRLMLWEPQHAKLVEEKKIIVGTNLKILNAKIAKSGSRIYLHLDRFESLIIDPEDFPDFDNFDSEIQMMDINSISDEGPVNIAGTISWKSQLRSFNRKDSSIGFVLNLDLYDGTGTIRLTLWDNHAKEAEKYGIGEQLKIINGYTKDRESVLEVHSNFRTQIIYNYDEENKT